MYSRETEVALEYAVVGESRIEVDRNRSQFTSS